MRSVRCRCAAGLAIVVLGLGALGGAVRVRAQGLHHDSSLPIEITADALEVLRAEQVATFTGNVDAVQGDLTLSADRLRVHYRTDDSPSGGAGTGGTIRLIEAFGNVFLTSPRETARGDVGVYDVAASLLTLEGAVVLTRDENVIRGQRLEMDLTTGRSRVVAAVTSAEGGGPEERVRAIFVPESGAPAAAPAADGGAPASEPPAGGPLPPGPKPSPES